MRPWHVALGGGVLASGVLLYFFATEKKETYEARGRAIEAAMATGQGQSVLAREAQAIKGRLETYGRQYTERLAQASADAHMARAYGITPARIQGLDRLARTIGAIGG